MARKIYLLFILLALTSCATYQLDVSKSRNYLISGEPGLAVQNLEPLAQMPSDDQLVYLLDYATALQASGDYKKSNEYFLLAEKIAEIKDYHSISRITGSMMFNQGMVQYKGENYEKLLIHLMLAINFANLGDLEGAMVETRKINQMLYKFNNEGDKHYEEQPFAYYLTATFWEADKKYDDAYIDYNKFLKAKEYFPFIQKDILRTAYLSRRWGEYEKLKKTYGNIFDPKKDLLKKDEGELVVLFSQGWAPRKRPSYQEPRLPELYSIRSYTKSSRLVVNDTLTSPPTEMLLNVDQLAHQIFREDYGALVANRMAGMVTKEVVSDQIRQKNEDLGNILWVVMQISDQADLRQWSTLPESLQIQKIKLPAGTHKIKLESLDAYNQPTGETQLRENVVITPGKQTFIYWRSFK